MKPRRSSRHICVTGKRRYLTEARAFLMLLSARNMRAAQGAEKVEQRIYQCPMCHGWHLTSKTYEEGDK